MLAQWGFAVGQELELPGEHAKENPFKVISVDHRSKTINRGVIIESKTTGTRYILVPSSVYGSDLYSYDEGDYERTLENEEPPAGELVQHVSKKMD